MKRYQKLLGIFFFLTLLVSVGDAAEWTGKVIDTFREGMSIQLDIPCPLQKGERVDVTYLAGTAVMTIGQYEVLQTYDKIFAARAVTNIMPPSVDMDVRVISFSSRPAGVAGMTTANPPASLGCASCQKSVATTGSCGGAQPGMVTGNPPLPPGCASCRKSAAETNSSAGGEGRAMAVPHMPSPVILRPDVEKKVATPALKSSPQNCQPGSNVTLPRRWWLGVAVQKSVSPEGKPEGVKIVSIFPHSPAEKAGLKEGDIISRLNKNVIEDEWHFILLIQSSNGLVEMQLKQGGKKFDKKITLVKPRFDTVPPLSK